MKSGKDSLVKEPIYQQLNRILRQLIESGEFKVGDKFLTERAICERFDVSRVTANKALSNLVSEGLLEFSKGVGTFVKRGVLDYELQALVSFTSKAKSAGTTPATTVLEFKKMKAKKIENAVKQKLSVENDQELYMVDRLRLADDIPVIYEHRYIIAEYCPNLNKKDLEGSLYNVFTTKYKLNITGSEEIIRVVNADENESKILDIEKNLACMLVIAVGFCENSNPFWWERTLYRGDIFELHNHLGPIREPQPVTGLFIS